MITLIASYFGWISYGYMIDVMANKEGVQYSFKYGVMYGKEWIILASMIFVVPFLFSLINKDDRPPSWKSALYSFILAGTGQVVMREKRWAKYLILSLLFPPITGLIIWEFFFIIFYVIPPELGLLLGLAYGPIICLILFIFNIWDASWRAQNNILSPLNRGIISGFLSFGVPGLGQAFCGEYRRARVYMIVSVCLFIAFGLSLRFSGAANESYYNGEVSKFFVKFFVKYWWQFAPGVLFNLYSVGEAFMLGKKSGTQEERGDEIYD